MNPKNLGMVKWKKQSLKHTRAYSTYSVITFRQNQSILFRDTYFEAKL